MQNIRLLIYFQHSIMEAKYCQMQEIFEINKLYFDKIVYTHPS
jgi:hypothetical protein